ncbi:unnamed protein product [Nippostrongylus brasiliensis]|uniref:Secreted protein n=1 Tax=Nippostrongylus brasiliensis TaxID=27835 RepID=A0A0N4Y6F9_NIPBR|nr:unnamed protein product [Nippostrongylus brasiliensis]
MDYMSEGADSLPVMPRFRAVTITLLAFVVFATCEGDNVDAETELRVGKTCIRVRIPCSEAMKGLHPEIRCILLRQSLLLF